MKSGEVDDSQLYMIGTLVINNVDKTNLFHDRYVNITLYAEAFNMPLFEIIHKHYNY